jgi:SAM-dependent methyltransferase
MGVLGPFPGGARRAWRALRGAGARKREGELGYWRRRLELEGSLGNRHMERLYTEHFGLEPDFYSGRAVLDVGCGPRGTLEWAHMAAERVGLDPLADSYRELGIEGHAMTYVGARAEQMPFEADHFDVVASFNSLDHVDRLDRAVAEIKRVLKPGGLFLLLTELGHDPTWEEPQDFSWEVVRRFEPELELLEERRYERAGSGLYVSLVAAVPYEESRTDESPGVLSAKFRKR